MWTVYNATSRIKISNQIWDEPGLKLKQVNNTERSFTEPGKKLSFFIFCYGVDSPSVQRILYSQVDGTCRCLFFTPCSITAPYGLILFQLYRFTNPYNNKEHYDKHEGKIIARVCRLSEW
jgi:hypothetical protein